MRSLNPPSSLAKTSSPNRLITPWSRSRRRTSVVSMICSKTISRPRRGWPRLSNAPALMSDSTVRLLSTGSGTRSAKSWNEVYGPLASRSTSSWSTSPSPTLRTADRPNVIAPGLPGGRSTSIGTSRASMAAKSVTERLTSGVSTLTPIALASARYTAALSRLLLTEVSRLARYSTG